LEIPGTWNIYQGQPRATCGASQWESRVELSKSIGQQAPMLDIELQDLVFAFLSLGLLWSHPSFPCPYSSLLRWEWYYVPLHLGSM
jgi:hypothetical protein